MTSLLATGYDNRGDIEVAYGFVYFSDGRRVAYTSTDGVVTSATGGWPAVTGEHVAVAEEYLRGQGIQV